MISEQTLDKTVREVKAVPYEQRRIIIYSGVHPNEGTAQLASYHENRWKDYGALVVAHPSDDTPHAIWERHKKECNGIFKPLDYSVRISETKVEQEIAGDDRTFFIRFYGTDMDADNHMFDDRTLFVLPSPFMNIGRGSDVFGGLFKLFDHIDYTHVPTDRILIEYYYEGKDAGVDDPFILEAVERSQQLYPSGVPMIFSPNDDMHKRKRNVFPDYVTQSVLNEEDIAEFNDKHVQDIDRLVEHLAKVMDNDKSQRAW